MLKFQNKTSLITGSGTGIGQAIAKKFVENGASVVILGRRREPLDETSKMLSKEYGWNHGLSEVVNALIEAGLHIEYLKEFDESPYDVLPNLVKIDSEMFTTEDKLYPLIFTLKASKFLY